MERGFAVWASSLRCRLYIKLHGREFFSHLLRNVELALGKVDLATARLCSAPVEDGRVRERIYDMFEAEFHRTVRAVLAVARQSELLESYQVLVRSTKLRNPYVDPMHLIQVDMLRRKRAGEDTHRR
jgi:phosphoenolpyruvate carboxylase